MKVLQPLPTGRATGCRRHWLIEFDNVRSSYACPGRSSIGDPTAIAAIQKARRGIYLPAAEEDLRILSKLQSMDYKDVRTQLTQGLIKTKLTNGPFLSELKAFLTLEDEASWRARVQRKIDHEKRLIQALREHTASSEQGK